MVLTAFTLRRECSSNLQSKYTFQSYKFTFNKYHSFGEKQVLAYNLFFFTAPEANHRSMPTASTGWTMSCAVIRPGATWTATCLLHNWSIGSLFSGGWVGWLLAESAPWRRAWTSSELTNCCLPAAPVFAFC